MKLLLKLMLNLEIYISHYAHIEYRNPIAQVVPHFKNAKSELK
jgi:hypothetical protein